jgi:amino acid transporter
MADSTKHETTASGLSPEASSGGYGFGTFGGVFTPSILTVFGLILFLRSNYVTGSAGIVSALVILTISSGITFLTGLSIAGISTNTPVAGGGAYFLISRVLGPSFGTAIGVALFLAQTLSVPFYILGFMEALRAVLHVPWAGWQLSLVTLALLVGLAWIGANWAIRCQYVILAILVSSIVVFMVGAGRAFSPVHFHANLWSSYSSGESFWRLFAIYFPAVTGIMAGVNMSGDLRDPARAIPRGTMAVIIVSFVVYGGGILVCGGMAPAAALKAQPFGLLLDNAWLGLRSLVVAGVMCATLSSAIGSILGAPRVLQAVARDGGIPLLGPFERGRGTQDEPVNALALTTLIAAVTLVLATRQAGTGGLDLVARIVTMVFLYTYGLTNLAAFVESFGANPSFRPRFRLFHWTTAGVGSLACGWVAFQIHVGAASLALAGLAALFFLARKSKMNAAYGDARRGFIYQRLRRNLLALSAMPAHPKNWRPTIVVLAGNPTARLPLVTYARWLGMNSGIVSLVSIVTGGLEAVAEECQGERKRLERFIADNALDVVPEVVAVGDFDRDLNIFLQSYSVGPIKPNIVVAGYARDPERRLAYLHHLRTVRTLGKSIVVVEDRGLLLHRRHKCIDCWWRGQANGSLMVILAHLLMQNPEWGRSRLRLLRQVRTAAEVEAAQADLIAICHAARIVAEVEVPVSTAPFPDVLRQHSGESTLVFLGFQPPEVGKDEVFLQQLDTMLEGLPSTLLVCSTGEADLQA